MELFRTIPRLIQTGILKDENGTVVSFFADTGVTKKVPLMKVELKTNALKVNQSLTPLSSS